MNSRMEDLMTALPSAMREYGVFPAPLSCNSHFWPFLPSTSPRLTTRPSPSCPAGARCYQQGTLQCWTAIDVKCQLLKQRLAASARDKQENSITSVHDGPRVVTTATAFLNLNAKAMLYGSVSMHWSRKTLPLSTSCSVRHT